MVYDSEWGTNFLLIGTVFLLWISGAVITVISFIIYRTARRKAAAVLACIGYALKLPVYVTGIAGLPDMIYRRDILMCLTFAAVIIAATGYMIHMIIFAIRDSKNMST